MAKPRHDWYLAQWLRSLKLKQADIARDLGWNKARVSLMIRGDQQYTRDAINELADYLHLAPYELLMHPDQAMAMRGMRKEALRVVETTKPLSADSPEYKEGTNG